MLANFTRYGWVVFALAGLFAGCVGVDLGTMPYYCSGGGQCPDGYSCRSKGSAQICVRDGLCPAGFDGCDKTVDRDAAVVLDQSTTVADAGPRDQRTSDSQVVPDQWVSPDQAIAPDLLAPDQGVTSLSCDGVMSCLANCGTTSCEKQCEASIRPSSKNLFDRLLLCLQVADLTCVLPCIFPSSAACTNCMISECQTEFNACQADK
ncbi:MAG: hypothetical protein H6707_10715 [Deltaproteobacteria bacterium]|nr:hypothetical protein [Deltaproteobacteria bacterium]